MFKLLQAKFDGRTEFPIEIQDICDAIVEMGYQDDVRVVAEEMELDQLAGTYVQWREPTGVYAEPKWVSLVIYPSNVDLKDQRLICAKELVHICDPNATKNNDAKEIEELAAVLSERLPEFGKLEIPSIKVFADKVAQIKAAMLLFPKAARLVSRERLEKGTITIDELVDFFQIPKSVLVSLLDPQWEEVADQIILITK